ncbi:MAG: hypothetical protein ACYCXG_03145 [Acidiferrobacter sp.]
MASTDTVRPPVSENLTRLTEGAFDALTDEMIARMAKTAGDGLTLLDEMGDSGIREALPVIARLVKSGDLARIAHLARVWGAVEDALTDEMITRLAGVAGYTITLLDHLERDNFLATLDKLTRPNGPLSPELLERLVVVLPSLVAVLEQAQKTKLLETAVTGIEKTRAEGASCPAPGGGLGGLWAILKDANNQRTLQALLAWARHIFSS